LNKTVKDVERYATSVYVGGTVITMDPSDLIAEAVAVNGQRIMAVGTGEEVRHLIGPDTKLVNLEGKTIIPGFYDSHGHLSIVGEYAFNRADLNSSPIGNINSIEECLEALRKRAQQTSPGRWVLGRGYDDTLLAEKRHPTRDELNSVSTQHPILATHISGHLGALNSMAMEIAGISRDTKPPEGGRIRKDPVTGEPNGVIEETVLIDHVNLLVPSLSPDEWVDALALASSIYAEKGVTTASDAMVDGPIIAHYQRAIAEDRMMVRTVINPIFSQAQQASKIKTGSDMLTIGGIKIFHDGSIQAYTACLSQPYHTPFNGDPTYRGYTVRSREKLADMVKELHRAGLQCVIHGNGDITIDDILYAFRSAQGELLRPDARHVIIHCQMASEEQLDEMRRLGVIPSFFVLHTYYWGDRHGDIFLGPERAARINPLKSALKRGIPFTTHCDTPVVPQNPLMSIWASVNRTSTSGKVIGSEQRISPLDAMRAYTINAARQNFEENIKGSIEPGKLADLVVLEENPLTCETMHIKDISVFETIVGGKTVYKASV